MFLSGILGQGSEGPVCFEISRKDLALRIPELKLLASLDQLLKALRLGAEVSSRELSARHYHYYFYSYSYYCYYYYYYYYYYCYYYFATSASSAFVFYFKKHKKR